MKKALKFRLLLGGLLALVLIGQFSCEERPLESEEHLIIDILDSGHKSLEFKLIDSLVIFDSTSNVMLSYSLIAKSDSTDLFILDKENPNYIYRFNKAGKFLNYIGSVGNLLGDVPSLSAFTIHDNIVEILAPYGEKSHIYKYDRSGKQIFKEDVKALGLSFERLESGNYFFYNSYNFPHEKWRLREVKNGSITEEYLENNYAGTKYPIFENNFYTYDMKSAIFFESFNPSIYRISIGNPPKIEYTFDAGRYSVPNEFWDNHIMDGFGDLMRQGFYNVFNVLENKEYVLIDLRFQREDGTLRSLQLFINKKTNEIRKCEANLVNHDIFSFPLVLTSNNQIGYLMNPKRLLEVIEKGDISYLKGNKKLNYTWDIYDNPVIGFVSLN